MSIPLQDVQPGAQHRQCQEQLLRVQQQTQRKPDSVGLERHAVAAPWLLTAGHARIAKPLAVYSLGKTLKSRGRKTSTDFFLPKLFEHPAGLRDIPAKPQILPSKPKEDKLSSEGTNSSTTTPSRGRPPPHRAVSGPKELIFVLFVLPEKDQTLEKDGQNRGEQTNGASCHIGI